MFSTEPQLARKEGRIWKHCQSFTPNTSVKDNNDNVSTKESMYLQTSLGDLFTVMLIRIRLCIKMKTAQVFMYFGIKKLVVTPQILFQVPHRSAIRRVSHMDAIRSVLLMACNVFSKCGSKNTKCDDLL